MEGRGFSENYHNLIHSKSKGKSGGVPDKTTRACTFVCGPLESCLLLNTRTK